MQQKPPTERELRNQLHKVYRDIWDFYSHHNNGRVPPEEFHEPINEIWDIAIDDIEANH